MLNILQLTDLHITPHAGDLMLGLDTEDFFQQTLRHAHDQHGPFDLILLTGDLAQDPCEDSYHRIQQHLHLYAVPCLCLPGNHDDFDLMLRNLQVGKVSCNKQLILDNWQLVLLNSQKPQSPVGQLADNELAFLEQALQSHQDLPTLVALHHPCFAIGSNWLDTMQIENSAAFLSLLNKYPQVKAVTCGHVHQAYFRQINHITFFATPASCFQFTPNSTEFSIAETPPGYRVFCLHQDGSFQSEVYRLPITMHALDRQAHEY
ncbi:MAG: phosphodiesterase [Methylomonas sp.]|nr:MAG: phosphodiesterase [Methylomonas sp.]